MPGKTDKRKKAVESGDEIQPGRQNKFRRTGSSKVSFATTIQGIFFDEDQKPTSILETQPTSFPTALGSPDWGQSPFPEPSKQPEEKIFTADQADEMSKMARAALQTLKTSEKKQLKHDLAAAQREVELSKNEKRNFCWRVQMYMNASEIANRELEDTKKLLITAEAELKATLWSNDKLKDMLRTADEKLEKVQCELAIVREEKSEMEKTTTREISK